MSRRRTLLWGWTLALVAIALFARAGLWQLERRHEKQAMLAQSRSVLERRVPRPLSAAAEPGQRRAYAWSAGDGRFADLPPILLDNQSRAERAGVRALRVFEPAQGTPLLVELGWLPLPGDRTMPAVPRPAGVSRVAGLLAPPPSAGLAKGTPVPLCHGIACADGQPADALLVIALDMRLLAQELGLRQLAPRILKLDPAQPLGAVPAYARDLDILPNTLPPERHLGYAVQWFGLAIAVLVTALVLTFRKRRTP